jgi:exodeoxyribonuclease VII small subunit
MVVPSELNACVRFKRLDAVSGGPRTATYGFAATCSAVMPAASTISAPRKSGNDGTLAAGMKRSAPTPIVIAAEPQRKGDFEKSLARLEEVVKRLESTDLSLDEAMKLFEEGVKLSRDCQKQLEEAEGRVEILLKKADGKIAAEPFEPEDESS